MPVPGRERLQAEARFDQRQARTVLERSFVHNAARAHQIGHDDGRHPEAELPIIRDELAVRRRGAVPGMYDVGRVCVVDNHRWWYVVIETTPFVKGYDEYCVVEITVVGQRVVGVSDKALPQPDI